MELKFEFTKARRRPTQSWDIHPAETREGRFFFIFHLITLILCSSLQCTRLSAMIRITSLYQSQPFYPHSIGNWIYTQLFTPESRRTEMYKENSNFFMQACYLRWFTVNYVEANRMDGKKSQIILRRREHFYPIFFSPFCSRISLSVNSGKAAIANIRILIGRIINEMKGG